MQMETHNGRRRPYTAAQAATYAIIVEAIQETGIAPPMREIANRRGLANAATVSQTVDLLVESGRLVFVDGRIELPLAAAFCPNCRAALTVSVLPRDLST